jgi:O-antigen/teichoic acid export membrane protein
MNRSTPSEPPKPRGGIWSHGVARAREILAGRTARTAGWMALLKLIKMLNALVIGIWLARYLGPTEYGVFVYVVALVLTFESLASFGMGSMVTREVKLNPGDEGRILGTASSIRFFGATLAACLAVLLAMNSNLVDQGVVWMTALMGASSIVGALAFLEYFFLARGRTSVFVRYHIINIAVFAMAKAIAILLGAGLTAIVYVASAEMAGIGAISLLGYARAGGRPGDWRFDRGMATVYVRRALPLIVSGLSGAAIVKLGVLFVAELRGPEEAAIYAVAARLSEIWIILPPIIADAAFPRLLELRRDDPAAYHRRLQLLFDGLAAGGTLVAIGATLVAGPVVLLLFGAPFAAASDILVIHIWSCLFSFQAVLLSKWFIAEELYSLSLWNNLLGALTTVILSLALVPSFGAVGASFAILAAFAMACFGVLPFFARGRPVAKMMVRALLWPLRLPALIAELRR